MKLWVQHGTHASLGMTNVENIKTSRVWKVSPAEGVSYENRISGLYLITIYPVPSFIPEKERKKETVNHQPCLNLLILITAFTGMKLMIIHKSNTSYYEAYQLSLLILLTPQDWQSPFYCINLLSTINCLWLCNCLLPEHVVACFH